MTKNEALKMVLEQDGYEVSMHGDDLHYAFKRGNYVTSFVSTNRGTNEKTFEIDTTGCNNLSIEEVDTYIKELKSAQSMKQVFNIYLNSK